MYHWVPSWAVDNVEVEGIKTLSTLSDDDPAWNKWAGRERILASFGDHALTRVSLLYGLPPIDGFTSPGIIRFCKHRVCYRVDYPRLVADGRVLAAWITGVRAKRMPVEPHMLRVFLKDLWPTSDFRTVTPLIFERVPHGIISVAGVIPPDYIERMV
jgi:hypothetical protein